MPDQERDFLISSIEKLQEQQNVLTKYVAGMKRRLDNLTEQFNNRPELQQLINLQDALAQLHQQLNEQAVPLETLEVANIQIEIDEIPQQLAQVQPHEYHLVFDRSGSRAVLMEALNKAQERLIIVCPWLNSNSIDADLMQKFKDCLSRNCCIDIGWGHLSDRGRLGKGWRYNSLKNLRQLERDYPDTFRLKLLGTHEKFLVCDSNFAMLGSHNLLTSSAQSAEREVGIRTTDSYIIQGLISRFDDAQVQDAQVIDKRLVAGSVSLDDAEALDALDIGEESDAILVNSDDGETDQGTDNSEDDRGTAIDAEEFLRRYNEKERYFAGINLAKKANLAGVDLSGVNLTGADLQGANINSTNLTSVDLSEANLSKTNLTKANLQSAKLLQANLSGANLSEANLYSANLTAVNLVGVKLIQATLKNTNLTAADLSKANLKNAILVGANFSGANLTEVNLVGVTLQKVNLSGADLSGANLCGANLSYETNLSGANLTSADLRGANLSSANLEKANLKEAKLGGANLNEANLSGAVMPDGTVHE